MNETFDSYLAKICKELKVAQDAFNTKYQIDDYDSWYYDQASGVFTFSNNQEERFFSFQCIGSFAPKAGTWLWSWSNSNTYPNVKIESQRIKEYGISKGIEKLTSNSWKAEEVDGWEMLALAYKLLNPLGVYRIPTDGIYMFLIFTAELTKEEAECKKENKEQLIDCDCHGLKRHAFVCQHLNKKIKKGFNEAFETWEEMELHEDDDLQAWCDACEEIRVEHDGWNEESEKYSKIKLICEGCYFEMKEINK